MPEFCAGLIVQLGGNLRFVPHQLARRVVYQAVVSSVPGTPIGMALVGGHVVSVIDLGKPGRELLVCELHGEPVAFAGLVALASGSYEAKPGGVWFQGEPVPELDLANELRRVEQQLWLRHGQEGDEV